MGLVEWCIAYGTENFALAWSIFFCIFTMVFIILAFKKSKSHQRAEEKLTRKKIKQQKEEIVR